MQSAFSKKFNEITSEKFSYIKLTNVDVNIKEQSIKLRLIYPADKSGQVAENEEEIKKAVSIAVGSKAKLEIVLTPSCFDIEYCRQLFKEFFAKFPSVAPFADIKGIESEQTDNDKIIVKVSMDKDAFDYCIGRKIDAEATDYLELFFTEKLSVKFIARSVDEDALSDDVYVATHPEFRLSMEGDRSIIPEEVTEFIGKPINEAAMYIEDCNCSRADEIVIVCGTVSEFKELTKADGSKTFYKFLLSDFTGKINCLAFTNKTIVPEKISTLRDGAQIVVKGQLSEREFRGEKSISLFVRAISYCKLPENFVKNEIYRLTPQAYTTVFPQAYIEEEQVDMFIMPTIEETPKYIAGKTYVIYDFETTGTDTRFCKIIEIGAVKMVDGKFTETFSALINPGEPLDERIVKITNITDEMLKGKPSIEEVFPDFNLFCDGAILVGHNSNEFDYKILARVSAEQKFRVTEEKEDTIVLAKKLLRKVHNYKLGTIAKFFGIVNENAHRAKDDAVTTAKVFVSLAKML